MLGNRRRLRKLACLRSLYKSTTFFVSYILSKIGVYFITFCEIVFLTLVLIGFKTKLIAYARSILLLSFGIAVTIDLAIKAPLDYSVWTNLAAAFLLAAQSKYSYSIDEISKNHLDKLLGDFFLCY